MTVKYNSKTCEVTIKLSWTETRQFLGGATSGAVKEMQSAIRKVAHVDLMLGNPKVETWQSGI